ncbi:EamA family transporter RarD [Paracoccus jiaweipingae]|uniref:EamA family transporter RarD n=1 Tax=unclassified Paracoccus (in: a-proteobacteria) TaxID=2688777 RepID=UPI00378A3E9B
MTERIKGLWAMTGCCLVWGLSAIFYKALAVVGPWDVLAHRTIWSLMLFGAILTAQGRLGALWAILRGPQIGRIMLAALMISLNWLLFIWSVQNGQAVQASLGYYIFPLVAVLAGVALFGERLWPSQWLAVAMAGLAVLVLTLGLGVTPWISLALAVSFGAYGIVKKGLDLGPMISVAAEVALLAPLALVWLAAGHWGWLPAGMAGALRFGDDAGVTALMLASGAMTAVPLMLFAYAARRVDLASLGLLQYLNPSLQFLVATLVLHEEFTRWHMIAFVLIWAALAIWSRAVWRRGRQGGALAG